MTLPALAAFQHRDWRDIPVEQVAEGVARQMIHSDRLMVCRLTIAAGTVTPVHSHMHDQITLVERGSADFFVEGVRQTARAGDVLVFPTNIRHGATMLNEEVVLVDIFSPPREEFLPKPEADR